MGVKEFIVSLPYLCRAKNASRWSKVNELQYEYELAYPDSVFAKNADDEKDPANRIETAFGFVGDDKRIAYCKGLLELAFLCHYKNAHGDNRYCDRIKILKEVLLEDESNYPDIMNVMTVGEVELSEFWDI